MTAHVIRAGAEHLPLPDNSVDLICTSPPYFGLRSYQDDGRHYDGQVGSEPTPREFLDVLIRCTREWMRVLKPSGSIWVNLGDKYAGPGGGGDGSSDGVAGRHPRPPRREVGIPTKSLMGLPWRYAIRCIDELGLILRAEVVWSKPNGLPESVTDRVRRSHEQWFHMVKLPRYYSAVDEIREPHTAPDRQAGVTAFNSRNVNLVRSATGGYDGPNPLGKLPGSVWTVPTEPLTLPAVSPLDGRPLPDHFAAFPLEWPRRIIRGWSPAEVCCRCGEGRRPVPDRVQVPRRPIGHEQLHTAYDARADAGTRSNIGHVVTEHRITGYACACPDSTAPATPGVVLDPFGGTGTVALMAHALGRVGITVDYSHDYSRVARWRTTDPAQHAKAAQTKPRPKKRQPPTTPGQGDLFGNRLRNQ